MNLIILSRNAALYSTHSIYSAARRRGHSVIILDHMRCELIVDKERLETYYLDQPVGGVQAIIPRIGASATNYGAAVIRQFEMQGIYSTLGSGALVRSRDKFHCLQVLAGAGIPVPRTGLVHHIEPAEGLLERMGGERHVLKLLKSTQGAGVILTESLMNGESILEAMQKTRNLTLVQEYIEESGGSDVRVFVVDNEVVATMKRTAAAGDFRSNFHRGGSTENVKITDDERRYALKACRVLGLEIAGVDILRSKWGPLIIEVNASPGLEGIETTTGVKIGEKIIQFVERKVRSKGMG